MGPLDKFQKEAISRRVLFLEREIEDIYKFRNFSYEEFINNNERRKILERTVENIVNSIIDISKILLAGEKIEIPKTYAGVISKLSDANFVTKEESKILENFVKLRNLLSHEYLDILWEEIKNFIHNIDVIEKFVKKVKSYIKE